ncbi:MAG: hypothetical protein ACM3JB_15970 [Acidobacteriaceae bacterium]
MKPYGLFVIGAVAGMATIVVPRVAGFDVVGRLHHHLARREGPRGPLAHTEERFEFLAKAPLEKVAPLMGADRERVWAPGWNPNFVYPNPVADQPGMVFTVAHGDRHAAWVNTEFDLKTGRVQYVYVIPNALVTVITIRMTLTGNTTHVAVEYDRTALSPEAGSHVRQLAENDRKSGPEWEKQINDYLASRENETTKDTKVHKGQKSK